MNLAVLAIGLIFAHNLKVYFWCLFSILLISAVYLEIISFFERKKFYALLKFRMNNLDLINKSTHDIKIELIKKYDTVYFESEIEKVMQPPKNTI